MEKLGLDSIKRDSVRRVYSAIYETGWISRHKISEITGLSLMTVGKIADFLCESGAALQEKNSSNAIGRRANYISLNRQAFIIVIDVSGDGFICGLTALSSKVKKKIICMYNNRLTEKENFTAFLLNIKSYIEKNMGDSVCLGAGIVVGNDYVNGGTSRISDFAAEIKSVLNVKVEAVVKRIIAAAAAVNYKSEGKSMFLYAGEGEFYGFFRKSKNILDFNGEEIGRISFTGKIDMSEKIQTLTNFLVPDRIYIFSDKNHESVAFDENLHNVIIRKIVGLDDSTISGCALFVSDKYINQSK